MNGPLPVAGVRAVCIRMFTSPWFSSALLSLVLVWEVSILLLKASRRLLWYDELLTFHMSNLRPFSLLLKALQTGADGMPPSYYILLRIAGAVPGDPHLILRLPSILGYVLTLLGVYWFARKRVPANGSLIAMLLITLSPFRHYALEARSYALLVGFLAVSAAVWQRIDANLFMKALFTFSLIFAVSC